jgi:hypothetical protein
VTGAKYFRVVDGYAKRPIRNREMSSRGVSPLARSARISPIAGANLKP